MSSRTSSSACVAGRIHEWTRTCPSDWWGPNPWCRRVSWSQGGACRNALPKGDGTSRLLAFIVILLEPVWAKTANPPKQAQLQQASPHVPQSKVLHVKCTSKKCKHQHDIMHPISDSTGFRRTQTPQKKTKGTLEKNRGKNDAWVAICWQLTTFYLSSVWGRSPEDACRSSLWVPTDWWLWAHVVVPPCCKRVNAQQGGSMSLNAK